MLIAAKMAQDAVTQHDEALCLFKATGWLTLVSEGAASGRDWIHGSVGRAVHCVAQPCVRLLVVPCLSQPL